MPLIDDIINTTIKPVRPKNARYPVTSNEAIQSESESPLSSQNSEYLQHIGFDPETIRSAYSAYDPSSNRSVLEQIYSMSAPKPAPVDEKKVWNAQTVAGIGDAIGMLGQMWAAGKGAHVRERGYDQSASGQVSNRVQQLRDLYKADQDRYDRGMYQSKVQDYLKGLSDYEANRKGVRSALQGKQKQDYDAKKFLTQLATQQARYDKDRTVREQHNTAVERHNKEIEKQGWARITDAQNRTAAYIAKKGTTGGYQMMIPADDNDTDAQTDQFGNRSRIFSMSKGQIDAYYRQALSDKAFMDQHTELYDEKMDSFGNMTRKYKPNVDIAAAYLKEMYDAEQAGASAQPNPAAIDLPGYARPAYKGPVRLEDQEQDEWGEFAISGL